MIESSQKECACNNTHLPLTVTMELSGALYRNAYKSYIIQQKTTLF